MEEIRFPGCSLFIFSVKCGATSGSGKGFPGRGSAKANSYVISSRISLSLSLANNRSLFDLKIASFFPGKIKEGALGNTASAALCPQLRSCAGIPKYRQEAVSKPTTFPPKGA